MTLLFDAPPYVPPVPAPPLLVAHSASGGLLDPIRYTPQRGQSLADAITESIASYGDDHKRATPPTHATCHPLDKATEALLGRAGLPVVYNRQVAPGTWELTHSEARS